MNKTILYLLSLILVIAAIVVLVLDVRGGEVSQEDVLEIPLYTSSDPPERKSDIGISRFNIKHRLIVIDTTPELAAQFDEYDSNGKAEIGHESEPNSYWIWVDARYDFMEVLSYINSFE